MLLYNNKSIPKLTDNYLLSITDRAGNQSSTITITIHVHNFVNNVCTICGEEIAPAGELEKWDYTLDDAKKTITLNKYTGTDENVTVYSNYDVGGECYKTRLRDSAKEGYSKANLFTNNKTVKNIIFQKQIDTSNVTNMENMFCNCKLLTSLNVRNLDTSNVKNMSSMFNGCSNLTQLDVSNLNTSNAENMRAMFANCISLVSLDLSNFDTSKVTQMVAMFSAGLNETSALTTLNLSNWNTSNVENMMDMFKGCSSLKTIIGLSSFNTNSVINMVRIFQNCFSLTELDLSNWNTNNVEGINCIFENCSNLTAIYVSRDKWIIKEGCDTEDMFTGCGVSGVTYKDVA